MISYVQGQYVIPTEHLKDIPLGIGSWDRVRSTRFTGHPAFSGPLGTSQTSFGSTNDRMCNLKLRINKISNYNTIIMNNSNNNAHSQRASVQQDAEMENEEPVKTCWIKKCVLLPQTSSSNKST